MLAAGIVGSPAGPATEHPPCLGAVVSMLAAAGPESTSQDVAGDAVVSSTKRVRQ